MGRERAAAHQQLGLHERWALVSPGLRPMLRLLRELAEDEIAELKTFADTVEARRNRVDDFYKRPAGHIDLCNIPVPVR